MEEEEERRGLQKQSDFYLRSRVSIVAAEFLFFPLAVCQREQENEGGGAAGGENADPTSHKMPPSREKWRLPPTLIRAAEMSRGLDRGRTS